MLAAAAELRAADRALRRLTSRWVRALVAPWWGAGWTNSDVLHALSHLPTRGGTRPSERCPAHEMRRPDGWVRHRLGRWSTPTGPLPAPRQWATTQRAVAATHGRAAAERLPYGASALGVDDLATTAAEHAAAAEQLVRRWAREFHEQREAPPTAPPASAELRAQLTAELARERRGRGGRSTEQDPADPAQADQHQHDQHQHDQQELGLPVAEQPDSREARYQRALARNRAEGHAGPRPGRGRRLSRGF